MADTITMTLPAVSAVTITPNPVDAGQEIVVTVSVYEKQVILSPYSYYSGDIFSGEV